VGIIFFYLIAIFAIVKSKRLISLLCALAYLVAFAHSVIPHEYHVHESLASCHFENSCGHHDCHHHHHFPHHSCDQFSSTYLLSNGEDDVIIPADLLPMVAVILTLEVEEHEIPSFLSFHDSSPAPPPEPYLSCSGLRAPPVA